jgi:Predicted transcriptional regulator
MKLKNSLEEAIFVLVTFSELEEHATLRSVDLSDKLGVSNTYLKKILRKLVVEEILLSHASKKGGFSLAKPLDEIYLLDVFNAIEGHDSCVDPHHLANKIYQNEATAAHAEENYVRFFRESEAEFKKRLSQYTVQDILSK